jgi:hypothetical protein
MNSESKPIDSFSLSCYQTIVVEKSIVRYQLLTTSF